jgi:hypothetical protein
VASDPPHPLFHDLAQAEVQGLRFERGRTGRDDVVELVLRRGPEVRAFRFGGVTALRLGGGFPDVGWLQVQDVSARQLDRLGVRVSDDEQSEAIEFWAASVDEIPEPAA